MSEFQKKSLRCKKNVRHANCFKELQTNKLISAPKNNLVIGDECKSSRFSGVVVFHKLALFQRSKP